MDELPASLPNPGFYLTGQRRKEQALIENPWSAFPVCLSALDKENRQLVEKVKGLQETIKLIRVELHAERFNEKLSTGDEVQDNMWLHIAELVEFMKHEEEAEKDYDQVCKTYVGR